MHLAHLRLRDFRNYPRLDADFAPGFHLLLGDNAQGKTNVLEAIYLMATLRSFRGVGGAQMIRHGQKGYFVGGNVVGGSIPNLALSSPEGGKSRGGEAEAQHPPPQPPPRTGSGELPDRNRPLTPALSPFGGERERRILTSHVQREIKIYWSARERKLALDGQPVKRLADYLGVLRAVVFCTEDLHLVKGAARSRRRFLDLLLAQTQPGYLPLLQRYMRAVRARNALLKRRGADEATIESFSQELVKLGAEIIRARRELTPRLSPLARLAYRRISHDAEELRMEYQPNVKQDFAVELAQSRGRERSCRLTLVGPHRDDVQLLLNEKSAAEFGSEGQKRTLAIALKMAQAEFLAGIHGSPSVLLIDDVMGELDVKRRSGLLPLLEQAHQAGGQVFMTATGENWPRELGRELQRWNVEEGTLQRIGT
ncbi:MAG: DNA replication/repair protein RecF [Verrucomicrobiota bacterium]